MRPTPGPGLRRQRRRANTAERFQRGQAFFEVTVQIAALRLAALRFVLQQLDFAADGAQVGLQCIEALRQLEQALVGQHPLDALHACIEVVHADEHRILFGRRRAASEREALAANNNQRDVFTGTSVR